jgi:hypothetical protein
MDTSEPFLEHPTGEFDTALDAMADGIRRLRALPKWDRWIGFNAQGQGGGPEQYAFAEILMLGDQIDLRNESIAASTISEGARVNPSVLTFADGFLHVGKASAEEVAQILDALFRVHFGIRPFEDEGGDYAVGAEWT